MNATSVASVEIVPQVLTSSDNYKRWSAIMKNYLLGQGLWDVVVSGNNTPDIEQGFGYAYEPERKAWKANNAKALHTIQLSCGPLIQDELSDFELAKDAWDHLSTRYGNFFKIKLDKDEQDNYGLGADHKKLLRMVKIGDSIEDINIDEGVFDHITSESGWTLLHIAVIAGNVKNVKKLVRDGNEEFVRKQDMLGHTALALAACYNAKIAIVESILLNIDSEIREELLIQPNAKGEIPILLAAADGHKEMTKSLYLMTPRAVLDGVDPQNRVLLFERCIVAKIFDVALKLLKDYPNLITEVIENVNEVSALVALAKLPSSFPSDSGFEYQSIYESLLSYFPSGIGFEDQSIYDSLIIGEEFQNSYGISESDIAKFVRSVTFGDDTSLHTERWLVASTAERWLVASCPRSVFANLLGIKEIYDKKYAHYEVLGILKHFSQNIEKFSYEQLMKASAHEAMLYAAENGIIEFINAMREANPDLLSVTDNSGRGIFWYAIKNRRKKVFQLIYFLNGSEKEMFRYRTDAFGNNLLHTAALLVPSSNRNCNLSPALHIQSEVQWFMAVKRLVSPKCLEAKNKDGKKPYEVFRESHRELVKAVEKWTKDTVSSYIAVASLILTIVFAAAFTVPGGNNEKKGTSNDSHEKIFTLFFMTDLLSFLCSAMSLFFFIWLRTARYEELDFLMKLPTWLLLGVVFLFVSVCFTMVAFYAALDMILEGHRSKAKQIALALILITCYLPFFLVLLFQMQFFSEILQSRVKKPISKTI